MASISIEPPLILRIPILLMPQEYLNQYKAIDRHGSRLPHWQQDEVLQFVTFRLGDALPQSKLSEWRRERAIWLKQETANGRSGDPAEYARLFSERIESWLDAGYGNCLLREPNHRRVLQAIFDRDEGVRCRFISWVIMPNHVHCLFQPLYPLKELLKTWKGVSARRIGQGSIWQRNYRDRLIRNSEHFESTVLYIRNNPKGLASDQFTLWESRRAQRV